MLRKINEVNEKNSKGLGKVANIIDSGEFVLADSVTTKLDCDDVLADDTTRLFQYYVMPQYGVTLEQLFVARDG